MGDIISEFHRELAELGTKLADDIMAEVPTEVKAIMDDFLFSTGSFKLVASVTGNLRRCAAIAACAYADWCATTLVRSGSLEKQPLPLYNSQILKTMSKPGSLPVGFLESFISRLTRPGTKLPLLGEIADDGDLIPNKFALMRWAAEFDWGA